MAKIVIDDKIITDWIEEIKSQYLNTEDYSYKQGILEGKLHAIESILNQSEPSPEETKNKLIVTSYTLRGRNKEHHKDVTSDEYHTEHRNSDGSILNVQVKPKQLKN